MRSRTPASAAMPVTVTSAPQALATRAHSSPMMPQPETTTLSPDAASHPCRTQRQATASGSTKAPSKWLRPSRRGTAKAASTRQYSAMAPGMLSPSMARSGHCWVLPARHGRQRPHPWTERALTRCPASHSITPAPAASTTPENS